MFKYWKLILDPSAFSSITMAWERQLEHEKNHFTHTQVLKYSAVNTPSTFNSLTMELEVKINSIFTCNSNISDLHTYYKLLPEM